MDRIKKIIYKKIVCKDSSVEYDTIAKGINEYITLNGLDVVAEKLNDEMLANYMNSFLMPLESFTGKMLVEYFNDFSNLSRFKMLSNAIFEQAKNKLQGKEFDALQVKNQLEELTALYTSLYKNSTMHQILDKNLSECKLDVGYVCDNSDNFSIRLNEIKKTIDGEQN